MINLDYKKLKGYHRLYTKDEEESIDEMNSEIAIEKNKRKNEEVETNQTPIHVQLYKMTDMDSFTDYFLTCHEYSFIGFSNSNIGIREFIFNFVKELWYINDLEKIWHGLYLKYQKHLINGLNFSYMESSIDNTLRNLENVKIENVKIQSKLFNDLLLVEGLKPLVLRPIFAMDDEQSDFYLIKTGVEELAYLFNTYKDKLLSPDMSNIHIIDSEITNQYLIDNCVHFELWAFKLNNFLIDFVLPKLSDSIEDFKDFLNDETDNSISKVEKILKRTLNRDEFIDFLNSVLVNIVDVDKASDDELQDIFESLSEITLNVLDSLIFKYLLVLS